ncbi:MAG: lipoyl(octanoyl) transferase LipB [Xanthomonadales bacterium]|nr:lipoyl(octanoyl) transferase LipB [Gammaproteobacteria bacterium]MBT8054209.1 lipoyl(octanoyl) transferase LipB [Gammaproteobacteria bacterium]NND57598.1 lipoyl(octanoyl) transferase LipB [Xanthomonadales bacterium]NNK51322.1 lipoyl(octanoyl) transferase LipB [Xanthomonadales bacterium]
MPPESLKIRKLGLADYKPVWRAMQAFTDNRNEDTADELWLVQHPPVFTQGQAGKAEHVLAPGDIPVIQVDRGGQVTYHGPGQIVAYPLIDIRRRRLGVKDFVNRIEEAIIAVLARYGVAGERIEGAPGIYVDGDKIASLGLRVRRGRSFHGLALNVDMDLEPFQRINPCGFAGLQVTQLCRLAKADVEQVESELMNSLARQLGYSEIDDLGSEVSTAA